MNIFVIQEPDPDEWASYLDQFPASPFLSLPWLRAFENSERTPICLRLVSGGRTVGVAAGLSITPSSALLSRLYRIIHFFSGPAVENCDKALAKACVSGLCAFAKAGGYTHLHFDSWDYPHVIEFGDAAFDRKIRDEYIISLKGKLSDIQGRVRRTVKSKVKKATQSGVTFHESRSPEFADVMLDLLDETLTTRMTKGYSRYSYYYMPYLDAEGLHRVMENGIARVFYAQKADQILSAQFIVTYGKRAYGMLTGTNSKGYDLGANAFIFFHEFERLHSEGIESLNLGGIPGDMPSRGLIFFKTSFGAKKHPCSGGWTPHLQGPFLNLLTDIYKGMSETKIKQAMDQWITGRNRL